MPKYVYGFLRENGQMRFGPIGIGQAEVYAVVHREIAALVSDSPPIRPDSLPKSEVMSLIISHQAAVEKVNQSRTVLPVKFGTTVQDDNEIRDILEKGRPRFLWAFEKAEGKVEMNVVALWADMNSQLRRVADENRLQISKESLAKMSHEKVVEAKVELGRRLQSALRDRSENIKDEILRELRGWTEYVRLHDVRDDSMILHAALWLDRKSQPGFNDRLKGLCARYGKDIHFKVVGPLPPHSFLTVEVKKIAPHVIEQALSLFKLGASAAIADIQTKYRELAHKHHPDRRPGDPEASRLFEEITAAYQNLLQYNQQEGTLGVNISSPAEREVLLSFA